MKRLLGIAMVAAPFAGLAILIGPRVVGELLLVASGFAGVTAWLAIGLKLAFAGKDAA